ncbi:MAG: biosynthetic peptidoglycan transglycosylase [Myxococcota bacterium]
MKIHLFIPLFLLAMIGPPGVHYLVKTRLQQNIETFLKKKGYEFSAGSIEINSGLQLIINKSKLKNPVNKIKVGQINFKFVPNNLLSLSFPGRIELIKPVLALNIDRTTSKNTPTTPGFFQKYYKKSGVKIKNGIIKINNQNNEIIFQDISGEKSPDNDMELFAFLAQYEGKYGIWAAKKIKFRLNKTSLKNIKIEYLKLIHKSGKDFDFRGRAELISREIWDFSFKIQHYDNLFSLKGKTNLKNKRLYLEGNGEGSLKSFTALFDSVSKLPVFFKKGFKGRFKSNFNLVWNNKLTSFSGKTELKNLITKQSLIADHAVNWPNLTIDSKLERKSDRITLKNTIDAGLDSPFVVQLAHQQNRLKLKVLLKQVKCHDLFKTIPNNLIPHIYSAKLSGNVGFLFSSILPLNNLKDFNSHVQLLGKGCKVLKEPDKMDVRLLKDEVEVTLLDNKNHKVKRTLGKSDPEFSPWISLPKHLIYAFISAEDVNFFEHRGFAWKMVNKAIGFNLHKGKIVKGASTISQQTVKNLYFSGARTISRKLEEAFLTWRLEKYLSKQRILEIYFNIIEMGPKLRGIRQGANLYFGKSPSFVNLLEAAHLAAIVPAPTFYYNMFKESEVVPDFWAKKIRDILKKMCLDKNLSWPQYYRAKKNEIIIKI